MYQNRFCWLKTNDKCFPYSQYAQKGRWTI